MSGAETKRYSEMRVRRKYRPMSLGGKKQEKPVIEISPAPEEPVEVLAVPENEPVQEPVQKFSNHIGFWDDGAEKEEKEPAAVHTKQINFLKLGHKIRNKLSLLKTRRLMFEIGMFAAFALLFVVLVQGARIFAKAQTAKTEVLASTTEALGHLKEASDLTAQKDFTDSNKQFILAEQNFSSAKDSLSSLGLFLNSFTSKGQTSNDLVDAGQSIAIAGQNLNQFYGIASQIKFSPAGLQSPDGFYATMNAALQYLDKAQIYIERAQNDMSSADQSQLPESIRQSFANYKSQLDTVSSAISQMKPLLSLFQQFIGSGSKNILVLFENNRELRPTGGFIGTYGYFRLNDGQITSQKISSIYDLDGQLAEKIAPPGPFHDLTDHWGLRDSNWFVDFGASAQKASDFYEMEGQETPDAVIAVTPDLFVDLLKVTGPIDFPKYNMTLTADNFRDQVQLATSVNYNKEQNTPKQMLADFAPLLMQKLASLPAQGQAEVFSALIQNLSEKNILFYDRNPGIEQEFESYNWAGSILNTDKDYLAVFNTNLGGKKTDLDITQNMKLESDVQPDGSIINTVTYTRSQGQTLIDPNTKNIDYVRFLVPQGSVLLSAQGFTKRPFYRSDGSDYANEPASSFTVDPELEKMDKESTIDAVSGTVVTEESGKTEFGNWIETSPGLSATVTIKYRLPFNINDSKKYSLMIQKQPGSTDMALDYKLVSGQKFLWYTPLDVQIGPGGDLEYKQNLKSDIFIGAVFDR